MQNEKQKIIQSVIDELQNDGELITVARDQVTTDHSTDLNFKIASKMITARVFINQAIRYLQECKDLLK